jgi:hypothetical protein
VREARPLVPPNEPIFRAKVLQYFSDHPLHDFVSIRSDIHVDSSPVTNPLNNPRVCSLIQFQSRVAAEIVN